MSYTRIWAIRFRCSMCVWLHRARHSLTYFCSLSKPTPTLFSGARCNSSLFSLGWWNPTGLCSHPRSCRIRISRWRPMPIFVNVLSYFFSLGLPCPLWHPFRVVIIPSIIWCALFCPVVVLWWFIFWRDPIPSWSRLWRHYRACGLRRRMGRTKISQTTCGLWACPWRP